MGELGWETVLPALLARAGFDTAGGFTVTPLTGGVSSDIVRVQVSDGREVCAKRALPQLKVAAEWTAPLERNHYEADWLRRASAIVPGTAPAVLAEDRDSGIVLLDYLPPEKYLLWKAELLAGRADPRVPRAVAEALGRIHAGTLGDSEVAAAFPTDHLIEALRLDPYLRHTASRHPLLASRIIAVAETTAHTKVALVHGDVSPKNILVARKDGHPVLLDAECAWYGDPAFDAAFCLNHLVLKSVHMSVLRDELLRQAGDFASTWLGHFPVSMRRDLEARVAALLPCLMLARVDGKSPVEYLDEAGRQRVRTMSMPMIASPLTLVAAVLKEAGR